MSQPRTAIIGLGSYLMGDEGVGIHAVELLRKTSLPQSVEVFDGGTAGVGLLHLIEGKDLVIIIDCADFGGKAGDVRVFGEEVIAQGESGKISLHAIGLKDALDLAKKTIKYPLNIKIIGIQPSRIALMTDLSPEVEKAIERLPEIITNVIPE